MTKELGSPHNALPLQPMLCILDSVLHYILTVAESKVASILRKVPEADLTKLLIKERRSVLFVGEGDFSFTVAFEAYRESERANSTTKINPGMWDGIISTRYESIQAPDFAFLKKRCRDRYKGSRESGEHIEVFDKMEIPPDEAWECDIDAHSIPNRLMRKSEVIWFQCPWIGRNKNPQNSTYKLIDTFLRNAGTSGLNREEELSGFFICIGIVRRYKYINLYRLDEILESDIMDKYDYLGADGTLIQSILTFGYHHQGLGDIHDFIKDYHITLIFRKK